MILKTVVNFLAYIAISVKVILLLEGIAFLLLLKYNNCKKIFNHIIDICNQSNCAAKFIFSFVSVKKRNFTQKNDHWKQNSPMISSELVPEFYIQQQLFYRAIAGYKICELVPTGTLGNFVYKRKLLAIGKPSVHFLYVNYFIS